MNQTRVVIYDCDGVLFDSRNSNRAFYNHILDHFGLAHVTEKQLDFTFVSTMRESVDFLFQDPEMRKQAYDFAVTVNNREFITSMDMEPHLRETLDRLRPSMKTAIATNRGRSMFQVLSTHGLTDSFDMVVTSMDVTHPKPHPECLLKILNHFGVDAGGAVYLGDSDKDRMVAVDAGVRFVAYKSPSLEAWAHLDDHLDLLRLLENE